ncbi:MAG: 3-phosphoshikimate 1-carboxyvinyltransferase [Thermodesulfovibrionales bacterium]|nr:3-phosphoshikimate 1-carboxyvinyltransferase [Thermodesulfovibrionales bacterium]
MNIKLYKAKSLRGELTPPPDKSITHRAIMFASIAEGTSIVRNPLMAEDPVSTMNAMRMLGINRAAEQQSRRAAESSTLPSFCTSELIIHGRGLYGLKEPFDVINCGNSGTTARLISGILAGNPFFSVLTGDDSLKQRPMARVINPLREMGAIISARQHDKYLPMAIRGGNLKAIRYEMPVASAQVKSCLILAGLYADGISEIIEPQKSRDHTERMLRAMGTDIEQKSITAAGQQSIIMVKGIKSSGLQPLDITVPGDFSSAAFFIVGALIIPCSEIFIKNICLNPTRTGLLEVIKEMGGEIKIENIRDISGEPVGDLYVQSASGLKAVRVGREIMPLMIDEFPILCVLATQAEGVTEIRGAEELRVKESDRIKAMATELRKLGVEIEEYPDGLAIKGRVSLKGTTVESYHDHRIAMSLAIAGLIAEGKTIINDPQCVDISFPGFFSILEKMVRR